MTTPVYTSPFTGTVVTPTDVSYLALPFSTNQTLYWPSTVNGSQPPAARIIDCVASGTGLSISLPQADQGTLGADILIRNLGSHAFTVTDFIGGQSVTVPVGIAIYFYLTDNTSAAGVWGNVTFGAGTAVADAATLAGAGLTTSAGKLATTQNVVDTNVAPTINDASRATTYNWTAGIGTFTLPVKETLSTGWYIGLRNSGTGALNIVPSSSNLINGDSAIVLNPGDSGFLFLDSTSGGFITVGWVAPSATIFNSATYDVDSITPNTFSLVSYAPIIQTYIAQSGTRTQDLAVTLPAITQIYVFVNNTGQSGYQITFQNEGSSQDPIKLSSGSLIVVLSDGLNLYILSYSSSGLFKGSNGSLTGPTYSYYNDTTTGWYLEGLFKMAAGANGVKIIEIDGTVPATPVTTITGTLKVGLISGGRFP